MSRARSGPAVVAAGLLLFAWASGASAQEDAATRRILQEHRDGLQAGADRALEGAQRIENAQSLDVETVVEGTAAVAEGFCMMVNSNAGAFEALGVDFSGLVRRGGNEDNAARYEQAEDLCGEIQAQAQSFALAGCTDVVVGRQTTLTASLPSGSYRFKASKGGVLDILPRGNRAILTGIAPGIVTVEAERSQGGARSTSSEVVHSLEVASINNGNPETIGIYDKRGRRIDTRVPVDVRPRGAGRRVGYQPAAPLVIASGDGGEVVLRPFAPGTTTLQAMTACGDTTGAPLELEILPCTDDVRKALRKEEADLLKRRDNILAAISDVLNDPEFERALREFKEHAIELTTKIIDLVVKAAVPGDAGGAMKAAGTLPDIYNLASHANALRKSGSATETERIAWMAYFDALSNLADVRNKNPVTGMIKTAMEAAVAAGRVGQDVGTTVGMVERLEELDGQHDRVIQELHDVWRRMELCKERRKPSDQPSDGPSKQDPRKPPQRSRSGTPEGEAPREPDFIDIDADDGTPDENVPDEKAPDEKPPGESTPPSSPASAAALAALASERQCPGWAPVAHLQTGVFTTLGRNLVSLHGRYEALQAELIDPLIEHLEASGEAIALFAESDGLPPAQREASMQRVGELLAAHDPEKLTGFQARLEELAVGTQACSGLLRNSFEVKIEELRLMY